MICILNVNPGHISTETVVSLRGVPYRLKERRSTVNINHARNQLVYDFMLSTEEWALLLDSDIVFTQEDIIRLYNPCTSHNVQIMSGVYGQPLKDISLVTHPDGTPWPDWPEGAIIESGPTGVGFMLVHKNVFRDIHQHQGGDFPWFNEAVEDHRWISEDIFFCRRAREAGYRIYTNTSVVVGHSKPGGVYYPRSLQDADA